MPEVVLTVDGQRHAGWLGVSVSNSMRQMAATFSLDFTDRWPGQQEKYAIREGSRCTLSMGGETVIDGWVDKLSPSYDTSSHSLTLSGRDLTGDLADCSHIGARVDFKDETLDAVARILCEPFGVEVITETDCGSPLAKARYSQGDSIHDFLLKLCRLRGVLPISYGDGKLALTTTGNAHSGAKLEQGLNIKSARGEFDSSERFGQLIVKGQGQAAAQFDWPPDEDEDADERSKARAEAVSPRGEATDTAVKRYRPLVIIAESGGDAASMQRRADWEAVTRAGHSRAATYTVQGWRSPEGRLWRINQLVSVLDPLLGISGVQLIDSVKFVRNNSAGTVTELGVVHPDAYAEKPEEKAGNVTNFFDD